MYVGYFVLTLCLSLLLTPFVYLSMYKLGIMDAPRSKKRKIHKKNIPLAGGIAIYLSFFIMVAVALYVDRQFGYQIVGRDLQALFIGGTLLMIGGLLDDKYNLAPKYQIIAPVLATLAIIGYGIGPTVVSSPFGGLVDLSTWQVSFGSLGTFMVLADVLVFLWLMGMMFTTKVLDGLDGLVTGVVGIGALVIFFLTTQPQWLQPDVAMLAIIFAGACFGFLIWNWHPAKIFLGEGGSLFAGYMLGVLAIISGGKIAIALLVVGLPVLDLIRVVIRRKQKGLSIFRGDDEHLHFKLMKHTGLKQWQTVLLMYAISAGLGFSALFLQSTQKFIALVFLLVCMLLIGFWFAHKEKKKPVS